MAAHNNLRDKQYPPPLMSILQHNWNHSHAICMAAFEGANTVRADIVSLQRPYVGGGILAHLAYKI